MNQDHAKPVPFRLASALRGIDRGVTTAFVCILAVLLVGSLYSSNFLSADYLLQQLQVASFLAMAATGLMIVILLGQIDLSVPWVMTVGAMMSTAAAGWGPAGIWIAIPVGILCGMLFGLINGLGVAYLRVPSMIFTLGTNAVAQGLMIVRTGGAAPQDTATDMMRDFATGHLLLGVPNGVLIWLAVGAGTTFLLKRTVFGRSVYAIGNSERAAYLSGSATRQITVLAFMLSGMLSAFGGVLLAGYSTKAYQGMGDPYLLPAIAAVVLGGTSILGGRGTYLGTVAGVVLITLLQSILSIMQIEEAIRQVIYGVTIILMLLLYGRSAEPV